MLDYLPHLTASLAVLDLLVILIVIPVVLIKKRDPTVAVAWCLVVLLVPVIGAALFWMFGYNYVHRRVLRKRQHRTTFDRSHPPRRHAADRGAPPLSEEEAVPHPLARLALAVNAFPTSEGNRVTLYHETAHAEEALHQAITAARSHVHLEFYIFRGDDTGRRLVELLTRKAREGVQVRLLLDSVGTLFLSSRFLRPLEKAGATICEFLPVNPLRSWVQVNLRNHRKIVVIDGEVAFTGGMNIGDEYQGKCKTFGYWRDTFLRIEGPGVAAFQRVFIEDWHFASQESLTDDAYFPEVASRGSHTVQVVESGPDQDPNTMREIFFAAILSATKRLWIATPYFVPDVGILDALRLARLRGVDVRLLCPQRPDHFLVYHAGKFYWGDMLQVGASVYQYAKGMMHAKLMIVDDNWAMVGSANLDNRSLHLNFEAGCVLFSPELIADLDQQFRKDCESAVALDAEVYGKRSLMARLTENACRLFSPIL